MSLYLWYLTGGKWHDRIFGIVDLLFMLCYSTASGIVSYHWPHQPDEPATNGHPKISHKQDDPPGEILFLIFLGL
jgi:hypothetical protein